MILWESTDRTVRIMIRRAIQGGAIESALGPSTSSWIANRW